MEGTSIFLNNQLAEGWAALPSLLLFQGGYNTLVVMIGTALLGMAAGLVGSFTMLRKRALMSDALAHSALPGLVLAFFAAPLVGLPPRNLFFLLSGAALSGVLGVFTVQFLVRRTRLHEDAAIGVVLSTFFGAGVVLLSVVQAEGSSGAAGLHHFIYGQTAALRLEDVYFSLLLASIAVVVLIALFKELRLLCFDPAFAVAQGWPVTTLDLLLMALVVTVTVLGFQSVGMLLVVALLIVPAAAARFWSEHLTTTVILSGVFGTLSGYLGAALSAAFPHFPAGAVIVLVGSFLFFVSFFLAPARGVFAASIRFFRLRLRVAEEHMLREWFEHIEITKQDPRSAHAFQLHTLRSFRGLHAFERVLIRWILAAKRLVNFEGHAGKVSEEGVARALALTRNHRLWEQYLIHYADVAPQQVDRFADRAEHVLSPDIVKELEHALRAHGRYPGEAAIPLSPHELGTV
jgi:manganese/zinc/iron transport system permease protein